VEYTSLYRGKRHYELSNHLGNVQVVVSDKRISVCDTELEVEYFKAEVLSAVDYYPFGSVISDRQWYANNDSSGYSFGFGGQMKDDEVSGVGNSYTAEFWQYDSRLGRRFNVDPINKESQSRYVCFSDNPVVNIDPKGNTDYYNTSGELIGNDGQNNGVKLLVLSPATEGYILDQVNDNAIATLSPEQLQTTIPVPTSEVIAKLDEVKSNTDGGATEYGFVAGISHQVGKEGETISSDVIKGTNGTSESPPTVKHGEGVKKLMRDNNGKMSLYNVHSHPNALRYNGDNSFNIGGFGPSGADISTAATYAYACLVLEIRSADFNTPTQTDIKWAEERIGNWVARTDAVGIQITIYNGNGELNSMSYDSFKSLIKTINTNSSEPAVSEDE